MRDSDRIHNGRLAYTEYDLVPVPKDILVLGVQRGDEALIRALNLRNNGDIVALIEVSYSTGQTRGWIEMNLAPEERVLSYFSTS